MQKMNKRDIVLASHLHRYWKCCQKVPNLKNFSTGSKTKLLIPRSSEILWNWVKTYFYFGGKHHCIITQTLKKYEPFKLWNNQGIETNIWKHDIPREIYSDNGRHYNSSQDFSKEYDFKMMTSSPNFLRSNRLSEKRVQVVKKVFKKAKETRSDFEHGLLN